MEKSYSVDIVRLNNVNVIDNHQLSNFISIKNKYYCEYTYTFFLSLLGIKDTGFIYEWNPLVIVRSPS